MLEIKLLGPLEVTVDGKPVGIKARAQRLLLSVLSLNLSNPMSHDRIAEAVWGDELPANPVSAIRFNVSELRGALGNAGDNVVTVPGAYFLDLPRPQIDVNAFHAATRRGREIVDRGDFQDAVAELDDALALWRGPPLPEFDYLEFAQPELRKLEEVRALALESRHEAALALGLEREVLDDLAALVEEYPYREALWGHYMVALHRNGRTAEALRAFQRFRSRLVDETGLEPSRLLADVEESILVDSVPQPARQRRRRLRAPIGNLVGRSAELARLIQLVDRHRLVAVLGPQGVGKSRLVIEAALHLEREKALAALRVDASGAESKDDLTQVLAEAVELPMAPSVEHVAAALHGSNALLVIDELGADTDPAAQLSRDLLALCPELRVVATGTARLGIPGEKTMGVGPLGEDDAATLFADRFVGPGALPDVDEIRAFCNAAGGLPLAIEIAAAQGTYAESAKSPGLPESLETGLGNAIASLPQRQSIALERLTVLDGPFDIREATTVGDCDRSDVLALASAFLLTGPDDSGEYSMLAPTRTVARAGAADATIEQAQRARFQITLQALRTEKLSGNLLHRTPSLVSSIVWALDIGDPRAIEAASHLARLLWRGGDHQVARRVLSALLSRTDLAPSKPLEQAAYFAAITDLAAGDLEAARRSVARHGKVTAALADARGSAFGEQLKAAALTEEGRLAGAIEAQRSAVRIWQELDDVELPSALGSLGYLLARTGRTDEAAEAAALADRAAAEHNQAIAGPQREGILGWIALWRDDPATAARHFTDQHTEYEALGHVPGQIVALRDAAWLSLSEGRPDSAHQLATKALRLGESRGQVGNERILFSILAAAAALEQDTATALSALARALPDVALRSRPPTDTIWCLRAAAVCEVTRGRLDRSSRLAGAAERLLRSIELDYPPVLDRWWHAITSESAPNADTDAEVGLFLAREATLLG